MYRALCKDKTAEKGSSAKENPENAVCQFDLVIIRISSAFEQTVYSYLPQC